MRRNALLAMYRSPHLPPGPLRVSSFASARTRCIYDQSRGIPYDRPSHRPAADSLCLRNWVTTHIIAVSGNRNDSSSDIRIRGVARNKCAHEITSYHRATNLYRTADITGKRRTAGGGGGKGGRNANARDEEFTRNAIRVPRAASHARHLQSRHIYIGLSFAALKVREREFNRSRY